MKSILQMFKWALGALFSLAPKGCSLNVGIPGDMITLYVKDMYKAALEAYKEEETKFNQIFKVESVTEGGGDKEDQLLGLGSLKRHTVIGEQVDFKSPVQGWAFYTKYQMYSDGLILAKETVEDVVKRGALGNIMKGLSGTWGRSIRIEKETLGAAVFNDGGDLAGNFVFNGTHPGQTDPSGDLLYDSEPLFNLSGNTRTTKGGGTYYNALSASLTLTPADFESLYNLHTATNNRDERDRIVRNPADTLLVRCGAEAFKADRIINSGVGMPNSQLNDKNPYYKIVSVIDWDYLTDGTVDVNPAYYVGKRQHPDFVWRERQAPEIRFFRDEEDLSYKASVNVRFAPFIKNFRIWSRAGGTSA